MLRETYELLDRLHLGIKHRCDIMVSYASAQSPTPGLVIKIEYRDNRDGKHYFFNKIFTYTQLCDFGDENILIDLYVEEVNERIRINYTF